MKKVLVFGTYDIFHKGHEHFLQEARTHGDHLTVVVALDETVQKVKGHAPRNPQELRRATLLEKSYVDEALLGNPGDKYAIIEAVHPDVICLGYDQQTFTETLSEELGKRNIYPEIIRLEAFHPEKYKSSKM